MMNESFIRLLNMSLTGSMVILGVILLRQCLRRAPKLISYCLWAVVLFRLLCPVSFSLPISLLGVLRAPAAEQGTVIYIPQDIARWEEPAVELPSEELLPAQFNNVINTSLAQGEKDEVGSNMENDISTGRVAFVKGKTPVERLVSAAAFAWAAGVALMLFYSVISLMLLLRKLKRISRREGDVCYSQGLETPCVLGMVRPRIYLPEGLSEEEKGYILLHEQIHVRRFDHIVKIISWLTLCLHWFNPFVWMAFFLSGRDMEMACDEAVLSRLGNEAKQQYSASLLNLATGRRIIGGVPLAFGEGDTGSRIRNVLKYKKPGIALVCVAVTAAVAAAVLLLANPQDADAEEKHLPADGAVVPELGDVLESMQLGLEHLEQAQAVIKEKGNLTEAEAAELDRVIEEMQQELERLELQVQEEQKKEESLAEAARLMSMERGEAFTWDVLYELQELVQSDSISLELYAGYDNVVWGDSEGYNHLEYNLIDQDSGEEYRLWVRFSTATNDVSDVTLTRLRGHNDLLLYRTYSTGGTSFCGTEEIDKFLGKIPSLSDWVTNYIPPVLWLVPCGFMADLGEYGGECFQLLPYMQGEGYSRQSDGWGPQEWYVDGSILRIDGERFCFEDGKLTEVSLGYNHAELIESEPVISCDGQTMLLRMNCDLYTLTELEEAEQSGSPIPEEEQTVDIWYVCIGREGAPYGYAASLNGRWYTKEQAIEFARSIRFTKGAFTEDGKI